MDYAQATLVKRTDERAVWRFGDERIVIHGGGKERFREVEVARALRRDYARMTEIARAQGIPILLLTYPIDLSDYLVTNEAIRAVSRDFDVEVVRTSQALNHARADGYTRDQLFVMTAGPHPTELLYTYVVESMLPSVVRALGLAPATQPNGESEGTSAESREMGESGPAQPLGGPVVTGSERRR